MREEDQQINEAYLNQGAIGDMQQRMPRNDKYRPGEDLKNSNYNQFSGLTGKGKTMGAAMASPVTAEQESTELAGVIDLKHEDTIKTPSNPSILIRGYARMDLESLTDNVRRELAELSKAPVLAISAKIADEKSVLIHKVKALQDVMDQMSTPQYKRKITLAKRR